VPKEDIFVIVIITLSLAIIIIPLLYGYYELTDEYLYIRKSIFAKKSLISIFSLLNFVKTSKSRYPMTRERIKINEHEKGNIKGTTYIGRKNRDSMYSELKKRCHNLAKETS